MHPILARGGRLAVYLTAWVIIGLLLAALITARGAADGQTALAIALPLSLLYGFFCLSSWYVARSMPLGATRTLRIAVTALTAAALGSSVWILLARAWLALLAAMTARVDTAAITGTLDEFLFGFGLLLYLLCLSLGYVLAVVEQTRDAERRSLEALVLAREAELRALRAQIDPHFLFNSLHSISALTGANPQAARKMCVLLADFFRDSLVLGREPRITLHRELALVGRFLEIEGIRFGDRLRVAVDAGNAADLLVPPLLLQPLVENAITHGIAHLLEGGTIAISAAATPITLTVVIENPCEKDRPKTAGAGVGLANVRARLHALYADDARVMVSERDGACRVEVVLPATGAVEVEA